MQSRPDHARELRHALTDAAHVCERLGLLAGRRTFKRQAGGVIIRCPWHEERDPSCSVRRGPDGTIAVRCFSCGASGDVLTLIAQAHGLSTRRDFKQVMRAAAELGGLWSIVHELETGTSTPERPKVEPPPPEPERDYPPSHEVSALWGAASPVTEDHEASAMLDGRGLSADLVAADDLARVIKHSAKLPRWASYQRRSWVETGHRLIIPMRDAHGIVRSVRAWRVGDGDSPKRLPPGGHKATDLVMACPIGAAMLAGTSQPKVVVIVEGEPDFITWATRKTPRPAARLGIVTGSWSTAMAQRVPADAEVIIRTHHDPAGDRYAQEIALSFRCHGCYVRRGGAG